MAYNLIEIIIWNVVSSDQIKQTMRPIYIVKKREISMLTCTSTYLLKFLLFLSSVLRNNRGGETKNEKFISRACKILQKTLKKLHLINWLILEIISATWLDYRYVFLHVVTNGHSILMFVVLNYKFILSSTFTLWLNDCLQHIEVYVTCTEYP